MCVVEQFEEEWYKPSEAVGVSEDLDANAWDRAAQCHVLNFMDDHPRTTRRTHIAGKSPPSIC